MAFKMNGWNAFTKKSPMKIAPAVAAILPKVLPTVVNMASSAKGGEEAGEHEKETKVRKEGLENFLAK